MAIYGRQNSKIVTWSHCLLLPFEYGRDCKYGGFQLYRDQAGKICWRHLRPGSDPLDNSQQESGDLNPTITWK